MTASRASASFQSGALGLHPLAPVGAAANVAAEVTVQLREAVPLP
jgi:hypothetical protein